MEPITSFEEMEPAQLKTLIKYISDDISQNENFIRRLKRQNDLKFDILRSMHQKLSETDPNYSQRQLGTEKFLRQRISELEKHWKMKVLEHECADFYDHTHQIIESMIQTKIQQEVDKIEANIKKDRQKEKELQKLNKSLKSQINDSDNELTLVQQQLKDAQNKSEQKIEQKVQPKPPQKVEPKVEPKTEQKVEPKVVENKVEQIHCIPCTTDQKLEQKVQDKPLIKTYCIDELIEKKPNGNIKCKRCSKVYKKMTKHIQNHLINDHKIILKP